MCLKFIKHVLYSYQTIYWYKRYFLQAFIQFYTFIKQK